MIWEFFDQADGLMPGAFCSEAHANQYYEKRMGAAEPIGDAEAGQELVDEGAACDFDGCGNKLTMEDGDE
jgi:hypothetical protein